MALRLTPRGRRVVGLAATMLVTGLIATVVIAAGATPRQKPVPSPPPAAAQVAAPTKYVVLTFDDGPDPTYTPRILDILQKYDAKATFFEVGKNVQRHPELTRQIHELGNSVQNHTWTHADLRKLSAASFVDQIQSTDEMIREQTGETPGYLRPPYGGVNALVTQRARGLDKDLVLWDVDSRDWSKPGTAAIVKRVLAGAKNGAVILMHDGGGNRSETVAALPTILKTLKAKGYGFETLSC